MVRRAMAKPSLFILIGTWMLFGPTGLFALTGFLLAIVAPVVEGIPSFEDFC